VHFEHSGNVLQRLSFEKIHVHGQEFKRSYFSLGFLRTENLKSRNIFFEIVISLSYLFMLGKKHLSAGGTHVITTA